MFAGFAASASAQTDITITGATAFRQATIQAIYDAYDSVGEIGTDFWVGSTSGSATSVAALTEQNTVIFRGKFPGVTGNATVVRTAFNGSVAGLRAIAGSGNVTCINPTALGTNSTIQTGLSASQSLRPTFSFSDVFQSTSPITTDNTGAPIEFGPVGSSRVGVVTFCMVANDGAPANLTNVTNQQARALWFNGVQKLSLFTGDPADTKLVLATGRNDGSGTRSAYLTEWTYGVANTVKQYTHTSTGLSANVTSGVGNGTITALTLVPGNGTGTGNFSTGRANDASTLWGNTAVGNGGYNSGSSLLTLMAYTSSNVTIYNGQSQTGQPNRDVVLLTWLSSADSRDAAVGGAKILAYNGVSVTPIPAVGSYQGTGFNEADFKKIATGAYSAWSYQHLYYWGSLDNEQLAWYNQMKTNWIPPALQSTSNGVRLNDLSVSRPDDGFPIVGSL